MRKFYKHLPVFIQHIAVTIVNNLSYYKKYGAIPIVKPLKKIIENNKQPINDANVVDRINKLIKEATEHVDYYSKRKHEYFFLSKLEDIKKLPILKKDTIKRENKLFISNLSKSYNSYSFKTSGSTGTPLYGKISLKDLRRRFLIVLACQKSEGIDYSKRVARFPGAEVADANSIYRKDFINNHFLFSIYNISEKNIYKYYDAFIKNKIQIVEGYPSTIYSLVKLFKHFNLKVTGVDYVLTTAEQLLDYMKIEIEGYFNCKIFDFYGSSEGSTFMYLEKEGVYVNSNIVGFVEVVNENYLPVERGKLGRMLITSFTSGFTPLIRYDIGDYCSYLNENNFTVAPLLIKEIGGRNEDVFITEEGIHFTRFSLCLKYLPEFVIESQLILTQRSKNVTLEYLSAIKTVTQNDFKSFEEKFQSMLGSGYTFTYIRVNEFDKTARGKLRAVKIIDNEKN